MYGSKLASSENYTIIGPITSNKGTYLSVSPQNDLEIVYQVENFALITNRSILAASIYVFTK
jgi:hypothetical protein